MKKILLALLALGTIGGGTAYYYWTKPLESMATQKADLSIPAAQIFNAFKTDETAANAQYNGKIVAVSGNVLESKTVDGVTKITLAAGADDATILCEFDPNTQHKRTAFNVGEAVTIKGECTGADAIDGAVNLARCAETQ
jgi:tRNA_anti-like